MKPLPRPVTLGDVAQRAGVSKSAASKALNGREGVSEQTRQRVHEVSQELGYARSSLPSDRALPLIALVSGDLTSSYSTSVVCGAVQAATRAGVAVAVSPTVDDPTGPHPAPPVRSGSPCSTSPGSSESSSSRQPSRRDSSPLPTVSACRSSPSTLPRPCHRARCR